jgi:hypothetical protein
VSSANGVLYGNQIEWGNVSPTQVLWSMPPSEEPSGNTLLTMSRRDD